MAPTVGTVYKHCPCSKCKNEILLAPRTIRRHIQLNGRMVINRSNTKKSSNPSEPLPKEVQDTLRRVAGRVAGSESFQQLFGDDMENRQQTNDQQREVLYGESRGVEVDGDLISVAKVSDVAKTQVNADSEQVEEKNVSAKPHADGQMSSNSEPYQLRLESKKEAATGKRREKMNNNQKKEAQKKEVANGKGQEQDQAKRDDNERKNNDQDKGQDNGQKHCQNGQNNHNCVDCAQVQRIINSMAAQLDQLKKLCDQAGHNGN